MSCKGREGQRIRNKIRDNKEKKKRKKKKKQ
jgi:hypothetical protein